MEQQLQQFPDRLKALAIGGLQLNTLAINAAGHRLYRQL